MKFVHVRTITWPYMVGFENKLVRVIIMTKQSVINLMVGCFLGLTAL